MNTAEHAKRFFDSMKCRDVDKAAFQGAHFHPCMAPSVLSSVLQQGWGERGREKDRGYCD